MGFNVKAIHFIIKKMTKMVKIRPLVKICLPYTTIPLYLCKPLPKIPEILP